MSKKTVQVSGFPFFVTSQVAKDFIEIYTGTGSIYALKIRNSKGKGPNPRVFAIVQFTTTKGAEIISSCSSLKYGSSYLNVRNVERDIVPKPRVTMLSLDDTTLHFGCQVSRERFKVLWERVNVMVNFGFGLRKVEILLSHYDIDYKLELGYDSIWQIQLRNPRSRLSKYLILQVIAAPRIYEKLQQSSGDVYGDPDLNYFRDTPDDQWIRCTDFTTSSCIGQSSAICLELPNDCSLSGISENFHYYTEDKGQFLLESSTTFSQVSELVPTVGPPHGHELPYSIVFKINCLVQNGCLAGPTLDAAFFRLVDPRNINIVHIECALEKLFHHSKDCCYEPVKWLVEQYKKYNIQKYSSRSPVISLDDGLVYTRRVQVTPSKVYFCGPEINVSNRVLRNYGKLIDNFIRVSFVDEDWEKMRSTDLAPRATSKTEDKKHTAIYKRILYILKNGITIGEKKFEFLAFSSSQLRDNSAWMFASSDGISAASIRAWMGDFHEIRNVAKYAARLGQSFSSSTETLSVGTHEIELIPDVELARHGKKYVFSDGIGKISSEFAHRVAKKCGVLGFTPSSFQIRYGGYKGVVAVDPDPTSEKKLSLRRSMLKYTSRNIKLDVLTWSKYQPCFLNRQIISLLSTLGVKDDVFEKKQKEAVEQLDMILTDPLKARNVLDVMSPGENVNVLKEMLSCGYKPDVEPYLSMMLQTFRALKLLELRKKTRIFVPNGRSLMGCMDEFRTLEYGQVFVQVSRMGLETSHEGVANDSGPRSFIVKGKVVVAKNPCLHPGDVRVLQAVDIPSLRHMVDCVVFPQKGHRPHPNECSGSDLDGDIYFVTWDSELIPPRQLEPMDYTPEPPVLLDHNVTIEEVQEYFTKYIVNDSLGIIANAHTVFADKEPRRAESDECIALARLFSIAVDFNKTGIPAVIPPRLQVREYPDFMEKPDKPTYESPRVIGKLFRAVKHIAPTTNHIKSFTKEIAKQTYDHDMEIAGFEDYIPDAHYYKGEYDFKLANLMDYYGIKTEPEILGGTIMKMSKSFDIRRDVEAIGLAVRSLKKEARKWFDEKCSRLGPDEDDDVYAKASAWYHVTYHPEYCDGYNEGMDKDHFLSFPWCVYDKLIHIKRMSNVQKRIVQSLQLQ